MKIRVLVLFYLNSNVKLARKLNNTNRTNDVNK